MKWTNKGHEFDQVAKEILKEEVSYYIWGAANFGQCFYEEYKDTLHIVGFIDSDEKKQGETFCSLPVHHPNMLENNTHKVIVASIFYAEISEQLIQYQRIENKDFFHVETFSMIYMVYAKDKLAIQTTSIVITDFCSLRCKHCAELIPYIETPQHKSLDDIMTELDVLFQSVDWCSVLVISGGDSMVHPNFNEVLIKICDKYLGNKVFTIEILTNAVVIPSEETLALFQKYNVIVRFTDYGEQVSHKQKLELVGGILSNHNVKYHKYQHNSWLDLGYPQEHNKIKEEDLPQFMSDCNLHSCSRFYKTRFYRCFYSFRSNRIGYCQDVEEDYYDLSIETENPFTKKELMEYLLGYTEKGYYEACKKCNGFFNVNTKTLPVGEQL